MATLRKRNGKWQVQVRRMGHKPATKSFRLRADAEAWARQVESEVERGIFVDRTFAEWSLLKDVLARYGAEVSPSKACYKTDLSRIKPFMPEGQDRRLAPGEQDLLESVLQESPGGLAAFVLALETAMRRGELARMHWEHVNFADSTLRIPYTKTGRSRVIPLSARAILILKSLPRHLSGSILNMKPDSITQVFDRACGCQSISNLRFHDLRHEAASRLFEKGLNTMEVATITGHRTLQMLQRYTHLRASDLVHKVG